MFRGAGVDGGTIDTRVPLDGAEPFTLSPDPPEDAVRAGGATTGAAALLKVGGSSNSVYSLSSRPLGQRTSTMKLR